MFISIEDKFQNLYRDLKNHGYQVYKLSEGVASDILIYSGKENHISSLSSLNSAVQGTGIFLINGDDKNLEQIDSIIKNRAYSSLF